MSVKKKSTPADPSNVTNSHSPNVADGRVSVRGSALDGADPDSQLRTFEQAVKDFRAHKFKEARELFNQAIDGPHKEISHNARLHVLVCDRRLTTPVLDLRDLDDHYNYAIERINARDLECARKHLDTAMNLGGTDGPSVDHVYYALAICASLAGDLRGAYENLKRAIELDPRNRISARNDSDFSSVAQQPLVQQLLYPEKFAN